jgi:hypothetical protein
MKIEKILYSDEILNSNSGSESNNFLTCKHRSEEEVEHTVKRCNCQGGNFTIKGYFCNKLNIFKVEPSTCLNCYAYEAK